MDPVFVKGVLALIVSMLVFVGSVWLLLSLILGIKMGYLVTGASFFGIMVILSGMWFTNGLGPKGPETTWVAIGVGPELGQVEGPGDDSYDVSSYPEGDWITPAEGRRLADQKPARSPCLSLITNCGNQDTLGEVSNALPVMESLVNQAVSPIPGKREAASRLVTGAVEVQPGSFHIADVRMRETEVEGKESIVAVGRAVPSATVTPETLPDGVEEAIVVGYLVEIGDRVSAGQPLLEASVEGGPTIRIPSTQNGRLLTQGLGKDDTVKPGVPVAVVDISGQAGAAPPAEVAAARVPGSVRRPATLYLIISLALFGAHMAMLRQAEIARRKAAVPATV